MRNVRSAALRLGPADRVTLVRAVLTVAAAALVVDAFLAPLYRTLLVTIAVVVLVLDGVDGWVARRTGTVSPFGARFDMEVDAFLILVLSVQVARAAGVWVLAIGLARYAFVAAGGVLPWLRESAPPRQWCKAVAVIEGVVLVVGVADVLPGPVLALVLVVASALLAESFGREVAWLWRHRPVPGVSRREDVHLLAGVT